jgi:NAD(P)H-hydrate epimerase
LKKYKNKKFVIDADAVYALGNDVYKKVDLKNKVLTPHHKEFADLIGISVDELENDLLDYGKKFAQETKSFLVLKGAPTLIFNPNGECFINTTGNPGMAKFGVGDVLTGILAAFTAQTDDIESAIISAVYLHSLSGDLLLQDMTEYGISATDLMENFPYAIKFLKNSILQSTEE